MNYTMEFHKDQLWKHFLQLPTNFFTDVYGNCSKNCTLINFNCVFKSKATLKLCLKQLSLLKTEFSILVIIFPSK